MKKNKVKAFIACGLLLAGALVACDNAQDVLINGELESETATPSTELLMGYADFENNALPAVETLSELSATYDPENPGDSEATMETYVSQLTASTVELLARNGISAREEFGSETDPRIAVVGLALIEYQACSQVVMTRADWGGCVLNAIGVGDLINGSVKLGAKQVAKKVVKAVLKKAVPYVGWVISVAEFAHCMSN